MTDGVDINWGLVKPAPDYVGDYQNAFRSARALAGEPMAANAFSPQTPGNTAGPPAMAGLDDSARARAAEQMDLVGAIGAGLKSHAYTERRALLDHMTPALAARGVPPGVITAFDPTDENLDAMIADAQGLGAKLTGGSA